MKRPAIDKLVYQTIFPRPKPTDPHNFSEFLVRCLVLEVRQEVHSFYGHLDTQEAKYPGLDYSHRTHRMRLSRWPWHRRLFRAFDSLGLTPSEIAHLTKWEGTKWAKERYEKEQNIVILDTAADEMPDFRAIRSPQNIQLRNQDKTSDARTPLPAQCRRSGPAEGSDTASAPARQLSRLVPENVSQMSRVLPMPQPPSSENMSRAAVRHDSPTATMEEVCNEANIPGADDGDDSVDQSIGLQLNEQLRERVAAHNAGDMSQSLDEDWEQWLKAAMETGNISSVPRRIINTTDLPFLHTTVSVGAREQEDRGGAPAQILEAARQGDWAEVPPFLQTVLRDANLATEASLSSLASHDGHDEADDSITVARETVPSSAWRRSYSELRLPAQ